MAKEVSRILNPAPAWVAPRSEYLVFWHGCTDDDRRSIESEGLVLNRCRVNTDFGRGFYVTTRRRQAEEWAFLRAQDRPNQTEPKPSQPVVLRLRIKRFDLARLHSLQFVRGDYDDEDYWSLVQHCRQSNKATKNKPAFIRHHDGPFFGWYDIVHGPVAANWRQRALMANTDQVGFHTPAAVGLLNDLIGTGSNESYSFFEVAYDRESS